MIANLAIDRKFTYKNKKWLRKIDQAGGPETHF